jgi:hypothetical protein
MNKHTATLADLARIFQLPKHCTKAVIVIEAGKVPVLHVRRHVFPHLGGAELREISESVDLVPRRDVP